MLLIPVLLFVVTSSQNQDTCSVRVPFSRAVVTDASFCSVPKTHLGESRCPRQESSQGKWEANRCLKITRPRDAGQACSEWGLGPFLWVHSCPLMLAVWLLHKDRAFPGSGSAALPSIFSFQSMTLPGRDSYWLTVLVGGANSSLIATLDRNSGTQRDHRKSQGTLTLPTYKRSSERNLAFTMFER